MNFPLLLSTSFLRNGHDYLIIPLEKGRRKHEELTNNQNNIRWLTTEARAKS